MYSFQENSLKNSNEKNFNKKKNIPKETYTQIKNLGSGSFGIVFLIQSNKTNIQYVCKNIDLNQFDKEEEKSALSEVSVLKKCKHPNIILFKEAFITKYPYRRLHLITEYAENGDLYKILEAQKKKNQHFEESEIINWLIQTCLALKYIHNLHVIHRDIKPQNLFLTKNGIIKIGDFGISKILNKNHTKTNTHIGTPLYMAPEVIESKKYDYKADIWSLGITFFELMSFKSPYKANNSYGLFLNIVNGYKSYSINNIPDCSYSNELYYIVNKMISNNPSKRPDIDEILSVPIINKHLNEFLEKNRDLYKGVNLYIKKDNENKSKSLNEQENNGLGTIFEENEEKYKNYSNKYILQTSDNDYSQDYLPNQNQITDSYSIFKEYTLDK